MALPGLTLPGLAQPRTNPSLPINAAAASSSRPARRETLEARSEWRFEVGFNQRYHIKLESGSAELFGVELAPRQTLTFSGYKGAIFTWQGCQLELSGDAESEYAGQETDYAIEWINVHGMLETLRSQEPVQAPRVLVVGPDFVGKTSLTRSLVAWSVRSGCCPIVINVDPREGLLCPPSALTAVAIDSQMDVETGFGIGPVSGPTSSPVRTPLLYQYPFASPYERPEVYKAIITRMALSVMNRLEEDGSVKKSGLFIDTPGTLNDPKSNYDLLYHIVSEFSINMILTIGSERLSSDLTRRFQNAKSGEDAATVLRISKPGGAIERDNAFMKHLRAQQVRHYFFGSGKEALNPHSHSVPFADLDIFRAQSQSSVSSEESFGPDMGDDDDDYEASDAPTAKSTNRNGLERITPSLAMTGNLIAIKFCHGQSEEREVRDSAVIGFLYVAEVDEVRKRVRFLAPHPQRWGDKALVWGQGWPEVISDLVL
jgi:polyribonucleotide 5'-hydroxyl-kinase